MRTSLGAPGVIARLFAALLIVLSALCGFDLARASSPITDAGGDIVGLCDMNVASSGGGGGGTTSGGARVVGEWVYDAYGEPIFASNPHPHAVLKCGHKGLFFDRLDAGVYDASTGGEMDRLVPDARGLYYARNRHHKPDWGRWLQQDPNATGLPVQAGLAFHGQSLVAQVQPFDLGGRFGNGAQLYGYLAFNPLSRCDATGLFTGVDTLAASSYSRYLSAGQLQALGLSAGAGGLDALVTQMLLSDSAMGGSTAAGVLTYGAWQISESAAGRISACSSTQVDLIQEISGSEAATEIETPNRPRHGMYIYRVWGNQSQKWGASWTPIDPRSVPNYRNAAGLPSVIVNGKPENSGEHLTIGKLIHPDRASLKGQGAGPLHGNTGGLPELLVDMPSWNHIQEVETIELSPPY